MIYIIVTVTKRSLIMYSMDPPIPKTAYILLWFPKPSETFIFTEVVNLRKLGLPLKVYTLYGQLDHGLSPAMRSTQVEVERLGPSSWNRILKSLRYWKARNPEATSWLFRNVPLRRWRSIEVGGENIWAFIAGFYLAKRFEEDKIQFIHAPWANGPATAAWVASKLTGIPFSFTGRAVDIYPPDGALEEKIRDSVLVRTNTRANVGYLQKFTSTTDADKINLTYNGYPLAEYRTAPVTMKSPYKILAIGRFAGFKGYDILLHSARILKDSGVDFQVTIAGSGIRGVWLKTLCQRLGLNRTVSFPGYVTHDKVSDLYYQSDMFVMPSIIHRTGERDGIPNVIMEALLHKLPVIATGVSGIGEVIIDGETGLLIEPGNPEALAKAIIIMTKDREAALKMAARGHDRVLRQFDPQTNHANVLELYKETYRKILVERNENNSLEPSRITGGAGK